jgi:hypothetical protein
MTMDKKISISSILGDAYTSIMDNLRYFSILAAIFISVLLTINYFTPEINPNKTLVIFVMGLISMLVYVKLAIMIHRSILLKEYNLLKLVQWSSIELKYIGWAIGIYLMLFIPMGIIMAFLIPLLANLNDGLSYAGIITIFGVVLMLFVSAQLAVLFPNVAISKQMSLADAWELTKNNRVTLFLLIMLIPSAFKILISFIAGNSNHGLWYFISLIISVFIIIFEISILSHCYQRLMQNYQAGKGESQEIADETEDINQEI